MCIAILCLKVEQKQVCEQLLHVEKIQRYYMNAKNNNKIDFSTMVIDVLLAMLNRLLVY